MKYFLGAHSNSARHTRTIRPTHPTPSNKHKHYLTTQQQQQQQQTRQDTSSRQTDTRQARRRTSIRAARHVRWCSRPRRSRPAGAPRRRRRQIHGRRRGGDRSRQMPPQSRRGTAGQTPWKRGDKWRKRIPLFVISDARFGGLMPLDNVALSTNAWALGATCWYRHGESQKKTKNTDKPDCQPW